MQLPCLCLCSVCTWPSKVPYPWHSLREAAKSVTPTTPVPLLTKPYLHRLATFCFFDTNHSLCLVSRFLCKLLPLPGSLTDWIWNNGDTTHMARVNVSQQSIQKMTPFFSSNQLNLNSNSQSCHLHQNSISLSVVLLANSIVLCNTFSIFL